MDQFLVAFALFVFFSIVFFNFVVTMATCIFISNQAEDVSRIKEILENKK